MKSELEAAIRDKNTVWYGPHTCEICGAMVVRRGIEFGELLTLDAPHEHHYPNHEWKEHVCVGEGQVLKAGTVLKLGGIPLALTQDVVVNCATNLEEVCKQPLAMQSEGGKARARKLGPQRRSEIAAQAAQARWHKAQEDVLMSLPQLPSEGNGGSLSNKEKVE